MAAPEIGNTGTNREDDENREETPRAAGFIVRNKSIVPSNHRANETLDRYLERHKVVALTGIDTRRLVRTLSPDGIFISNGPGDPAAVTYAINTLRELIGKRPIFGICLGHQLLALASGARTYKLKFGHRGLNQPVKDLTTGRVEITSQNHGFAVDVASLPTGVRPTHVHLNDGTSEGIEIPEARAFSVQFHPEAAAGPHDTLHLFERFVGLIESASPPKAAS
jgi:carbamoyl-phosphate synthase small subunit